MLNCRKLSSLICLMLALIVVLSGCLNRNTPAEEVQQILEKVVELEIKFENQQGPIVKLEKQEHNYYEQILTLGMKEFDQVVKLSNKALETLNKRKTHMKEERESLLVAEKQFERVQAAIKKIKNKEEKKAAHNLFKIMKKRYKTHDELYHEYVKALEYDKELYSLFKKKDVSLEELEAKLIDINETYEKVLILNNQFNNLTEEFNQAKKNFYKLAGIKIEIASHS